MARRSSWGTSLLVLLVLAGAGFAVFRRTSSCTVGVSGADATLTVRGWRARALCDALVEKSNRNYYVRASAPTGNVLCEYDDAGRHYTVRDSGVMMLIGRAVCAELAHDPSSVRRSAGM